MGKGAKVVIFLFLLASLSGCARQSGGGEDPSGGGSELGREFAVERGREVGISGERLTVRFVSVTSESRCPEGAQCVWEGYARILVRLVKEGEDTASVRLNTPDTLGEEYPSKVEYHGYTVELVDLEPYPTVAEKDKAAEYVATLVVHKAR